MFAQTYLIVESCCHVHDAVHSTERLAYRTGAFQLAQTVQQRRDRPMTAFQRWISSVRMRPMLTASHGQFFLSLWFTFAFSVCVLSDAHAQSMRQDLLQPNPQAR